MTQLQEQMDAWLVGTGLNVETLSTSVMDLLVGSGAFEIAGIVLHVDDQAVKFMPVFLYGQGVTGCVEATFHDGGHVTSQGRLFMRSGCVSYWTFAPPGALSPPGRVLMRTRFFACSLLRIQLEKHSKLTGKNPKITK